MPISFTYRDPVFNANQDNIDYGAPKPSAVEMVLGGMPGGTVLANYQSWKSARTIMRGGWSPMPIPDNPGMVRHFLRQQWDPRSWTRYSNQNIFVEHHGPIGGVLWRGTDQKELSFLGRYVQRQVDLGDDTGFVGRNVVSLAQRATAVNAEGKVQPFIEGGILGRSKAFWRTSGSPLTPELRSNYNNFIDLVDPTLSKATSALYPTGVGDETVNQLMAGAVKYGLSQSVSGFAIGSRGGLTPEARGIFDAAGKDRLINTADYVAENFYPYRGFAGKKLLFNEARSSAGFAVDSAGEATATKVGGAAVKDMLPKLAGSLGVDLTGWLAAGGPVDVVGDAILVASLAKLGVELGTNFIAKPALNLAKDSFQSFTGQIYKAPFGMGFKDNSVAASSRSRGVMAISNSRLNARSALGQEAAMAHARWG